MGGEEGTNFIIQGLGYPTLILVLYFLPSWGKEGAGGRGEVTSFSFEVSRFIILTSGLVNHL